MVVLTLLLRCVGNEPVLVVHQSQLHFKGTQVIGGRLGLSALDFIPCLCSTTGPALVDCLVLLHSCFGPVLTDVLLIHVLVAVGLSTLASQMCMTNFFTAKSD